VAQQRGEFRTDVKGIYTAHPAIVPDARKIKDISYAEVITLAELGTEVRQLRAVRYAARYKLPLHLRSSFHDEPGTLVTAAGGPEGRALAPQRHVPSNAAAAWMSADARFGEDCGKEVTCFLQLVC